MNLKTRLDVKSISLLKAKEAEGLKAFRKLQRLLSKRDIENIEKSMKAFRVHFTRYG